MVGCGGGGGFVMEIMGVVGGGVVTVVVVVVEGGVVSVTSKLSTLSKNTFTDDFFTVSMEFSSFFMACNSSYGK